MHPEEIATGTLILAARPAQPLRELVAEVESSPAAGYSVPSQPLEPVWQGETELDLFMYPPPWLGPGEQSWNPGLPPADSPNAFEPTVALVRSILGGLRSIPDAYFQLRKELHEVWCLHLQQAVNVKRADGRPFTDYDLVLIVSTTLYRIQTLFETETASDRTTVGSKLPPKLFDMPDVQEHAERIRREVSRCLRQAGVKPDLWREVVTFGLLFHPDGIAWLPSPYAFGIPRDGDQLQRPLVPTLGLSARQEREAVSVHRRYREAIGFKRSRRVSGPKKGSKTNPSPERTALDRYLIAQAVEKDRPMKELYNNAEVGRLYAVWKGEDFVTPSDRTVRRLVKEAKDRHPRIT